MSAGTGAVFIAERPLSKDSSHRFKEGSVNYFGTFLITLDGPLRKHLI